MFVFDDRELVDGQPVVVRRLFQVDDLCLSAADRVAVPVLDGYAIHKHAVEGPVAGPQRRALRPGQLAVGVVTRGGWKINIEAIECGTKSGREHNFGVVCSFGIRCVRGDIGPMGDLPSETAEPVERHCLDRCF